MNSKQLIFAISNSKRESAKEGVHLSIWKFWLRFLAGKLVAPSSLFLSQDPNQAKIEKSTFHPQLDLNPGPSIYKAAVLLTELHCQTA